MSCVSENKKWVAPEFQFPADLMHSKWLVLDDGDESSIYLKMKEGHCLATEKSQNTFEKSYSSSRSDKNNSRSNKKAHFKRIANNLSLIIPWTHHILLIEYKELLTQDEFSHLTCYIQHSIVENVCQRY